MEYYKMQWNEKKNNFFFAIDKLTEAENKWMNERMNVTTNAL